MNQEKFMEKVNELNGQTIVLQETIDEIKNKFEAEDINKYIRGETLTSDIAGWCVITHKGVNIGWAKGSSGVLKNHFPKYMRF